MNKMHTVPFKLNCGIILVPAKVNEEDGYFAFDTGAMQTAINKAYFPEMTGEHIDIAKFSEGVKESIADKGILNSLSFSDIERSKLPVLIMDLMYVENVLKTTMPDLKLLGTLGIDVIGDYTVLLDYESSYLILDPKDGFENPLTIPMEFEKLPVIEIEVIDRMCKFVLDTGANTCLLGKDFLNDPQLTPTPETPNIVTIPVVRVGTNEYKSITAAISDISAIQKRVPVEGVIGYQILAQQRSVMDFKNKKLIFEKLEK
ncbi:MAG: aspartyl protease family protein [Oscillospiraceae bacterium]|nr:aspartyl protease family protein [Oscillospiraceae bacterium]